MDEIQAYSERTNTRYPNWDALVEAEGNGYVLVGVSERPGTVPIVVGPYPDQAAARRARARKRPRWVKQEKPFKIRTFVRVLWKDEGI